VERNGFLCILTSLKLCWRLFQKEKTSLRNRMFHLLNPVNYVVPNESRHFPISFLSPDDSFEFGNPIPFSQFGNFAARNHCLLLRFQYDKEDRYHEQKWNLNCICSIIGFSKLWG
jgi:hypothetical protein